VLADGAANTTGRSGAVEDRPELVHLVASRASGARFEAFIRPRRPLGPAVAHQLEVPEPHLLDGEDVAAALARFRAFLGEESVLCTWGSFVVDLLEREGFGRPASVDLRDLSARHLRRRTGGIGDAVRALGAGEPSPRGSGRAGRTVGRIEVVLARLLAVAREKNPGAGLERRAV
jgi:DTW domain-containing protein